ncbi:DUF971 domain-containing protein [Massilia sp. W12]|uniref:DUF971 domain-containing protein n=1 Tax=Massilia sp. W12 TaxID=3126507 RepID=UPI0030D3DB93
MHTPTEITVHTVSRTLEIAFEDGAHFHLPFEYLRVYSPSAEVRGHNPEQAVLQTGKRDVLIEKLAPVGHYALQIFFSDGHDSGLFSWNYLHEMGEKQAAWWEAYLQKLDAAGHGREAGRDLPMVTAGGKACQS